MAPPLRAYHNDPDRKALAVERAHEHLNLGRVRQGVFGAWEIVEPGTAEFRGCAVGCLAQPLDKVRAPDPSGRPVGTFAHHRGVNAELVARDGGVEPHEALRREFNFSRQLAVVIDAVFEASAPRSAKRWPLEVVEAIAVGADVGRSRITRLVRSSPALARLLADRGIPSEDGFPEDAWERPDGTDYLLDRRSRRLAAQARRDIIAELSA